MARAIKKVKVKKERTSKFYIIISSIVLVLIGGIIALVLSLYVHYNTEDTKNLFSEYTKYKINYDQIDDILNSNYHIKGEYDDYEEVFIIVYNNSYEFDDSTDEDVVNSKSNALIGEGIKKIKELKDEIDAYNSIENKPHTIAFFMINSSLTTNSSVTTIGGSDDSETYAAPSVIHIYNGEYKDTQTLDEIDYMVSGGNGDSTTFNSVLTESADYVRKSIEVYKENN